MPDRKPLGEIAKDLLFDSLPMDSDEKWEAIAAAVVKVHEERKWRPITIGEMYKRTRILGMSGDGDVFICWHEDRNGVWYWNSKHGAVQPIKWQPLSEAPNA